MRTMQPVAGRIGAERGNSLPPAEHFVDAGRTMAELASRVREAPRSLRCSLRAERCERGSL
jgi:hypothetical protein